MKFTLREKLRYLAIVGLVGYTLVRFVVVRAAFEQYGTNPWIFLAIDITTDVTYVLSIEHLVVALTRKKRPSWRYLLGWSAVAGLSFLLPYAYIFGTSRSAPESLWIGAGLIILLLLINAAFTIRRRVKSPKAK